MKIKTNKRIGAQLVRYIVGNGYGMEITISENDNPKLNISLESTGVMYEEDIQFKESVNKLNDALYLLLPKEIDNETSESYIHEYVGIYVNTLVMKITTNEGNEYIGTLNLSKLRLEDYNEHEPIEINFHQIKEYNEDVLLVSRLNDPVNKEIEYIELVGQPYIVEVIQEILNNRDSINNYYTVEPFSDRDKLYDSYHEELGTDKINTYSKFLEDCIDRGILGEIVKIDRNWWNNNEEYFE